MIIFFYPSSPHNKYNVTVDVEKLENRLRCLLSDNLACAGRSLPRRVQASLDKLHAITENITKHDDSIFTEGGKPKIGLNCLHNFNNEKRHYIKSGVEKDVLCLVEDLDKVMAKYNANMKLAPGPQHLKQGKGKSREKKRKRGSSQLVKIEEKEHAAFSVPWEEPPLLMVLVFCNA